MLSSVALAPEFASSPAEELASGDDEDYSC